MSTAQKDAVRKFEIQPEQELRFEVDAHSVVKLTVRAPWHAVLCRAWEILVLALFAFSDDTLLHTMPLSAAEIGESRDLRIGAGTTEDG